MRLLETAVRETNKNNSILQKIWTEIVKMYASYSSFIHGILPDQLGDLLEYLIDIAVVVLLIRVLGGAAFHKKDGTI